jgi:hypothetical protein
MFGLSKVVDDARLFCRTFPDSNSDILAEKFPVLKIKGGEWIETNVVKKPNGTDSLAMGTEIYRSIEEQIPELRKWPASAGHTDPRAARDDLALDYYEQLKRLNRLNQPERKSIQVLRTMPLFTIWEKVDQLGLSSARRLSSDLERRGKWDADEMYSVVGILFDREGPTISDWCGRARKSRSAS